VTVRNLEYLFRPASIAVIGASDRPASVGGAVTRNLLAGGFAGTLALVNREHGTVAGRRAYATVSSLENTPDLAVICTPPATVPGIVAELGDRGTKAAVVLTAGLNRARDASGRTLTQAMLDAAKPHLLRILGPNCVGLLVPGIDLNASFAHAPALPGRLAFVSQSGALTTALLDWARMRGLGFSHFVSLGDSADIDFGDTLDYLASDATASAILLYIESISHARKFMSAARAASRNKPIIVVKGGRAPEGAKAAASHTGALIGADEVYDAALRRAGMVRVKTMLDLFVAAETLARARPLAGERLAIVTNGGGPGVMAADSLALRRGILATLAPQTIERLDAVLPPTWSHGNPVDIIGDAPAERYVSALQIALDDPQSDALLFIHAPTAIVDSTTIAAACVPLLRDARKPVFSCWLGGEAVAPARRTFAAAGLPTYDTPEEAVTAFLQVADYRRNQEALMQTPPVAADDGTVDTSTARAIVQRALNEDRTLLGGAAAKEVLAAYGIATVETRIARDVDEAVGQARALGFPVVLKIDSPDISHKSDVGGVALNLASADMVRQAATAMLERVRSLRPTASVAGFIVQQMVRRPRAHELIVGATSDPVFGPVILFGQGGIEVEVTADKAVALPPLNLALAHDLIAHTRVAKLLAGYRDRPAADRAAIASVLLSIARLLADVPEIVELDINPLLADERGALALDARMRVAPAVRPGTDRFAIRPYPKQLEETIEAAGQRVLLRPIRPEDEPSFKAFIARISPEDAYFRFFHAIRELPHAALARFTQIDYDREMVLVAVSDGDILGEARAVADPDNVRAEFALLVRSDWAGKGLGYALLAKLIGYVKARKTEELFGDVLAANRRMLGLAAALGFTAARAEEGAVRVTLRLADP